MTPFNRRHFLRLAASAAAFSSMPYSVTAKTDKKLGVALLGLGYYSRDLLGPALQLTEHCELRGIITGSPEKIPPWQQKYAIPDSHVYSYDTLDDIANNPDIDIVYVVTPTATHLDFAEVAAKAGKHVWCEKPMEISSERCQRMIDVCAQNSVSLSIGYRMQHEPNTQRFIKYRQQSPFGAIEQVTCLAGYGGNGAAQDYWRMKWSMGGGALYDMGVYPLNAARYLTGLEPVAVTGRHEMTHPAYINADDTTHFTLEFANGLRADCSTSVVKSFNTAKVNCQTGWYELRPMQAYRGVTGYQSDGKIFSAFAGNQQARQMDNDALAILTQQAPQVPGEEGLKDIAIIEKIFASAKQNGQRVSLV